MSCFGDNLPLKEYRIKKVKISGNWLVNDTLLFHLIQPVPSSRDNLLHDTPRPESIYILSEIFNAYDNKSVPQIIVFPELCFGAKDFRILNALIHYVKSPVLVLAGFGYTTGEHLLEIISYPNVYLLSKIQKEDISFEKVYNGGWCWENNGKGQITCTIHLKNFSGSNETNFVKNLHRDSVIIRYETDDLIIFPLLCSDIFCNTKVSAFERISQSLLNDYNHNKKAIITGHIYSLHPEHNIWIDAIDRYTELQHKPLMLLANQSECEAKEDKNCKAFNLTGVFTHKNYFSDDIVTSFGTEILNTGHSKGVVLMNKAAGAASGKVIWKQNDLLSIVMEHSYNWHDFELSEKEESDIEDTW